MNPRVREAIEKGPHPMRYEGLGTATIYIPPETPQEFALRIAKLCGEVAAGKYVELHGIGYSAQSIYDAIRSEFDLGRNDGR